MRAGLVQLNVSDDPATNLPATLALVRQAAAAGAGFILTPECTNILSSNRDWQRQVLRPEGEDLTLAALRAEAAVLGVWLLIGSLGISVSDGGGRFANRSFLIAPDGGIVARYDKIHMFDVAVTAQETFRESAAYRPGTRAMVADTPFARLGMSVCYDIRFPHLYRALAQAGAEVLLIPAAFNHITGAAHWQVLARARAIETGCYVLAPAQCGTHPAAHALPGAAPRRTHGHSLAIGPWGEIVADGGDAPGVTLVDLNREEVTRARARIPSLTHDRAFEVP